MVALDEPDHPLGAALGLRELGTATRVIEVRRERPAATGVPAAQRRCTAIEKHGGDAMPESRGRGLGAVMQKTREDEIGVGTLPAQDVGRALGVPFVTARHGEIAPCLHDALDRAQRSPVSALVRTPAGENTSVLRTRGASSRMNSKRNGPYF